MFRLVRCSEHINLTKCTFQSNTQRNETKRMKETSSMLWTTPLSMHLPGLKSPERPLLLMYVQRRREADVSAKVCEDILMPLGIVGNVLAQMGRLWRGVYLRGTARGCAGACTSWTHTGVCSTCASGLGSLQERGRDALSGWLCGYTIRPRPNYLHSHTHVLSRS